MEFIELKNAYEKLLNDFGESVGLEDERYLSHKNSSLVFDRIEKEYNEEINGYKEEIEKTNHSLKSVQDSNYEIWKENQHLKTITKPENKSDNKDDSENEDNELTLDDFIVEGEK